MVIKSYYISGLKLGLFIIVGLLLINYFIDQKRIDKLNEEFLENSWDMEDSRLFLLFSNFIKSENSSSYCDLLGERLIQIANSNTKFLEKLEEYEKVNIFSGDYKKLKTTFSLRNLELFFYYSDYKKTCKKDVHYILYFYPDGQECTDCKIQANVLDNVRDICKNTVVFAFPNNSDVNVINLLVSKYGITQVPSIIIDDGKTLAGITSKEDILKKLNC